MLEINDLEFKWPDSKIFIYNMEINQGEIVTIEGPSGIGKSTLIDLIAGFLKPISGEIKWCGNSIIQDIPNERPTSTIFQSNNLFEHLTCYVNVALGINPSGNLNKCQITKLETILFDLGVQDLKDRMPDQISGGQQARIALARSLISNKPIILLDEPVSSLDQRTRKETLDVLRKTSKLYNVTLIIVSHHEDDREFLKARPIYLN